MKPDILTVEATSHVSRTVLGSGALWTCMLCATWNATPQK